jgi:cystathionine beta-lyase family protein involved in aluminum resistance
MKELIREMKSRHPEILVMVDNCYGEMVEEIEPPQIGADVTGGSLIKNLGGTIAPTGGYVAGKKEPVLRAAVQLTSPGIGPGEGATLGMNRLLFQGLFFAPVVVGQALEGAVFASHLLEGLGFRVNPRWTEPRTDIIQAVILGEERRLRVFCRGIQKCSPVDSRALPVPVMNPGYRDPIIMAGGTFIQGSSLELSADGPLREPYAVYLQGGTSYIHIKSAALCAVQEMAREGLLP